MHSLHLSLSLFVCLCVHVCMVAFTCACVCGGQRLTFIKDLPNCSHLIFWNQVSCSPRSSPTPLEGLVCKAPGSFLPTTSQHGDYTQVSLGPAFCTGLENRTSCLHSKPTTHWASPRLWVIKNWNSGLWELAMGHSTNKQTSTVYGKLTESYKVKLTVLNRNLELQEINRYDLKLIYCILFIISGFKWGY